MLAHAVGESINVCVLAGLDVDPHEILRHVLVENFWGEYAYGYGLDRGDKIDAYLARTL